LIRVRTADAAGTDRVETGDPQGASIVPAWTAVYPMITGLAVVAAAVAGVAAWRARRALARTRGAADAATLGPGEERFRTFAEMSADWFWETDLDQRYTYHSQSQAWREAGIMVADLIGRRRPELMAELQATPDPTPPISAAMAEGRPFHDLECQLRREDGAWRWVRFSGVPVHDATGRLVGYRGAGRDVTEDKRILRNLEIEKARYRSMFRNAVQGMFRTDRAGRFVEVNPAFARMHGCPDPEDFLARFPHGRDVFVDQAVRRRIAAAVRDHGHVRGVEGWARRADGSRFPFAESVWAVTADDGELIGFEGIAEDTSEQQAARQALEASEQRYRITAELTSDIVYAYALDQDGTTRLEWVAGSLDGIGPTEMPGPNENCWRHQVHPDDHPILDRRLPQMLAGETPVDELRLLLPDGRQRWVRLHGRAEFDPETGRPVRILGAASDITARRQAEERLRENAQLLEHAVRIANLGHWHWDEGADRLLYCSPELAAMLGMSIEEYFAECGTPEGWTRYVHPDDLARVRDVMARARAEAEPYEVAYRFVRKDGALRHGLEFGAPVLDHHGRLIRTTGTLQDVTEAKETEAALRAAKETAEIANRAKSEFLANMSHELRTPLNAVIGFAEVLEAETFGQVGTRNREYAAYIRESGTHLLEIISEILDVSKAEAGMIELDEQEVTLDEVVAGSFRLVQSKAAASRLELVNAVPPGLPAVRGDSRRLKQVALNLLSNAIKFTAPGGRVTARAVWEDDGALCLDIADTGIGIAERDLERVFEPFSQADSGLARKHEGTGLGLPLTRALVELHGGALWLDSTPGRGTVAHVRLPAERVLAPALGTTQVAGE
jgi:PAS domain S-box-containing protein